MSCSLRGSMLIIFYMFMVFRARSSWKRSTRKACCIARAWAGVGSGSGSGGSGSGGSGSTGTAAGTATGSLLGGFGLFLEPGGRPLRLGADQVVFVGVAVHGPGAHGVGGVGQLRASETEFLVRRREGKDLEPAAQEARAQEVVDAQRLRGRGELCAQLLVV